MLPYGPNHTPRPTAANDHVNHKPPTHNSDGWIRCETCGGWVVHQPKEV